MQTFVIDSISKVTAEMRGRIMVTGLHGGFSAAHLALAHSGTCAPGGAVFNYAGMAGVKGLELLNAAGVVACAAGFETARIG